MTDNDVEMLPARPTKDQVFDELAGSDEEYHRWREAALTCVCQSEDCIACAVRDCPRNDCNHYHHDGCPSRCEATPRGDTRLDDCTDDQFADRD